MNSFISPTRVSSNFPSPALSTSSDERMNCSSEVKRPRAISCVSEYKKGRRHAGRRVSQTSAAQARHWNCMAQAIPPIPIRAQRCVLRTTLVGSPPFLALA